MPLAAGKSYEYGEVLNLRLESQRKTLLLLVLPVYRGKATDKVLLQQAINNLCGYIRQNNITSIAMNDVGVSRFGYPK
jgi:hypothetical protein